MHAENHKHRKRIRIAQHELGEPREHHPNGTEEVIVPAQPDQARRGRGAAPAEQDEDRRGVRDQEGDEAEEGGVAEAFGVVAGEGFGGLEEEPFVLIRAHGDGDLAGEGGAIGGGRVVGVGVVHFVVDVG